jgi:hypothetical protein
VGIVGRRCPDSGHPAELLHCVGLFDLAVTRGALSLAPVAIVLLTIAFPKVVDSSADGETANLMQAAAEFASGQPIFWPSFALFLGSLSLLFLFKGA